MPTLISAFHISYTFLPFSPLQIPPHLNLIGLLIFLKDLEASKIKYKFLTLSHQLQYARPLFSEPSLLSHTSLFCTIFPPFPTWSFFLSLLYLIRIPFPSHLSQVPPSSLTFQHSCSLMTRAAITITNINI